MMISFGIQLLILFFPLSGFSYPNEHLTCNKVNITYSGNFRRSLHIRRMISLIQYLAIQLLRGWGMFRTACHKGWGMTMRLGILNLDSMYCVSTPFANGYKVLMIVICLFWTFGYFQQRMQPGYGGYVSGRGYQQDPYSWGRGNNFGGRGRGNNFGGRGRGGYPRWY